MVGGITGGAPRATAVPAALSPAPGNSQSAAAGQGAQQIENQNDDEDGAESDSSPSAIAPLAVAVITPASAKKENQNNKQDKHRINLVLKLHVSGGGEIRLLFGGFFYGLFDLSDFLLEFAASLFSCALGFEVRAIRYVADFSFTAPFTSCAVPSALSFVLSFMVMVSGAQI